MFNHPIYNYSTLSTNKIIEFSLDSSKNNHKQERKNPGKMLNQQIQQTFDFGIRLGKRWT